MTSSGPRALGAKTRVSQLWHCYQFELIVVSLGKDPLSNIPVLYLMLDANGKLPMLFIYNCHRPVKREHFPGGSVLKSLPANVGATGDTGSFSELGRSPGGGNGNPLQYSCLENAMDRGAWQAAVHGVTKSRTGPHHTQRQYIERQNVQTTRLLLWKRRIILAVENFLSSGPGRNIYGLLKNTHQLSISCLICKQVLSN